MKGEPGSRKLELLPSDLRHLSFVGRRPNVRVSVDTETSGLRTDEGARISTVSVAWLDPGREWEQIVRTHQWAGGIQTYREEVVVPGQPPVPVVSFAWPFDQGVVGTGKPEDKGQESLWPDTENQPESEYAALLAWLWECGSNYGLVMQNQKFDCHQFRAGCRRWPALVVDFTDFVVWDTQNGNDLLFGHLQSTSLKGPGTATEHLWGAQESDEKKVISDYLKKHKLPAGRWDLMPWDVIARYADQDARLTARLERYHSYRLAALSVTPDKSGWLDGREGRLQVQGAAARRQAVTQMLYRMEKRGLPFDVELARKSASELQARAAHVARQLPFKPPTLATAKHYWFGKGEAKGVVGQGYEPLSTTAKGAPSLTADDVNKLVARELPGSEDWRDYQKLVNADSKWYTGWAEKAGPDGRLRTSVRQNGTRSGRFSVEGIQLQAIPHDYKLEGYEILEGLPTPRALIGAGVPEGWQLWELDLANAEARVAALFAGCQRMLDLILEGKDLHGETARELFHVEPGHPEWGEKRQVSKRANFSLIFGVGWVKLQADVDQQTGVRMSDHETQSLVLKWRRLYPEYGTAIKVHADQVMERYNKNAKVGWITTANGERRWFNKQDVEFYDPDLGRVTKSAHKAFNQRVQASLGQFAIDWWLEADAICNQYLTEEELETGGLVLTVHDSSVLLLPDRVAEKVVRLVQEAGVRLWSERFPGVPGGVDASLWAEHS